MQRRGSAVKSQYKFKENSFYFYKKNDDEAILLRCNENQKEANISKFEIFKECLNEKSNIYYKKPATKSEVKLESAAFILSQEQTQVKEEKKNIKGKKIEVFSVSNKIVSKIEGIKEELPTKSRAKKAVVEKSSKASNKKKIDDEEEEENNDDEEEEQEEDEDKEQITGRRGRSATPKQSQIKSDSKAKSALKQSGKKDVTPQKKQTKEEKTPVKKQAKQEEKTPAKKQAKQEEKTPAKRSTRLQEKTPAKKSVTKKSAIKKKKIEESEEDQEEEEEENQDDESEKNDDQEEQEDDKESEVQEKKTKRQPKKVVQLQSKPKAKVPIQNRIIKKKQESDDEMDEENDGSDQEEEEKKNKKKQTKKSSAKKPAAPKKDVPPFKSGRWNHKITDIVEKSELLEGASNDIQDECCSRCTNKELIRAAQTGNQELFKKLLNSQGKISTVFQRYASENDFTVFEVLLKNNDKDMIKILIDFLTNQPEDFSYTVDKECQLKSIDTGYNSKFAYGVATRKVALGRGGKEGNNAFVYDLSQNSHNFDMFIIENILTNTNSIECLNNLRLLQDNYNFDNFLNSQFGYAVKAGNYELSKELVKTAVSRQACGLVKIHEEALTAKTAQDFKKFDKNQANQQCYANHRLSPVLLACINPNTEVLKKLIEANNGYHNTDEIQRKPVHYAAACETPENLQYLIDKKQNTKELDRHQNTPLHLAAQFGRVKNVELLLSNEEYYDKKKKNLEGNFPIHNAARYGHLETLKAFKESGVKLSVPGKNKMQCLHFAAAYGHFDIVQYIVENKGKVDCKDKWKRTPLMLAVRNNSVKIVSYLLSKGAEFDHVDSSDNSSLHYAGAYGFHECIDLLVQAGANINLPNSWNLTPLSVSLMKNHSRCVKKILQIPGVDVNCKDDQGKTLLMLELEQFFQDDDIEYVKKAESIKFWLEKGADINQGDINGNTPLHYICNNWDQNIKIKAQKDMNYPPKYMYTLHEPTHWQPKLEKLQERDNKLFKEYKEKAEEEAKKDKDYPSMEIEQLNDITKQNLIKKHYKIITEQKQEEIFQQYKTNSIVYLANLFIDQNVNVNCINSQGISPLEIAVSQSNFTVFKILIDNQNTNVKTSFGINGIYHTLVKNLKSKEMYTLFEQILEKYGDLDGYINKVDQNGFTPILTLLKNAKVKKEDKDQFFKVLRLMKTAGADFNAQVQKKFEYREGNEENLKKEIQIQKEKEQTLFNLREEKQNEFRYQGNYYDNYEAFQNQDGNDEEEQNQEEENEDVMSSEEQEQEQEQQEENNNEIENEEKEENEDDEEENDEEDEEDDEDNDQDEEEEEMEVEEDDNQENKIEEEIQENKQKQDDKKDQEQQQQEKLIKEAETKQVKISRQYYKNFGLWSTYFMIVTYQYQYLDELLDLFKELGVDSSTLCIENYNALVQYLTTKRIKKSHVQALSILDGIKNTSNLQDLPYLQNILHTFFEYEHELYFQDNLTAEMKKEKTETEQQDYINQIKQDIFTILVSLSPQNLSQLDINKQSPISIMFSENSYQLYYLREMFKYPEEMQKVLNLQDSQGQTILHKLFFNKLHSVENLDIFKNANALQSILIQDKPQQSTAFHYLLEQGDDSETTQKCIEVILQSEQAEQLVTIKNKANQTPLQVLINSNKNLATVPLVLNKINSKKEIINNVDKNGYTALWSFINVVPETKLTAKYFKQLVQSGADASSYMQKDTQDIPPVLQSLNYQKYKFVKSLVEDGKAEINFKHQYYQIEQKVEDDCIVITKNPTKYEVPLFQAIQQKNEDNINTILKLKADTNYTDTQKRNSLHYAINVNNTNCDYSFEVEKSLINFGSKITQDETGRTPLHYCFLKMDHNQQEQANLDTSQLDPYEGVASLCSSVNKQININSVDKHLKTALHYAARRNASMSAKYLLRNGADINAKNQLGNTPLGYAFLTGQLEIATVLIEKGADINIKVTVDPKKDIYTQNQQNLEKGEYTLFDLGLINNWQGICFLLIEFGYDILEACQAIISKQQFQTLKTIYEQNKNNDRIYKLNHQKQNLIHKFAIHGSSCDEEIFDEIWEDLQKQNIDLDLQDQDQKTPLIYAIENKFFKVFDYLIQNKKSNVNVQDKDGKTPLHHAILQRNTYMFDQLLSQPNINLELQDKNQRNILHYMTYNYCHVSYYIRDKNILNENDFDDVQYVKTEDARIEKENKEIKENFEKQKEENDKDDENNYQFNQYQFDSIHPIINEDAKKIKKSRRYQQQYQAVNYRYGNQVDAQVQLQRWEKENKSQYNASYSQLQLLKVIQKIPKNILNQQDKKGRTPLSISIYQHNTYAVQKLTKQENIDIYSQDEKGYSAIHVAIQTNYNALEIMKKNYKGIIEYNQKSKDGQTCLHLAALKGQVQILDILDDQDLEINVVNNDNQTPLHLAVQNQKPEFYLKLFAKKGINVNIQDKNKQLPLHLAVKNNDLQGVHYLLNHGSDVNTQDIDYQTPLSLALSSKRLLIAAKLLCNDQKKVNIKTDFVIESKTRKLRENEKRPQLQFNEFKKFIENTPVLTYKDFVYKIEEIEEQDPEDNEKKITNVYVTDVTVYPVLYYSLYIANIMDKEHKLTSSKLENQGNEYSDESEEEEQQNQYQNTGFGGGAFGTNQAVQQSSNFISHNQNSLFGQQAQISQSLFGTTNTGFGQSLNNNSIFGNNNTGFGQSNNSLFGNNSGFGQTYNNNSLFGNNNTAFGNNNNNSLFGNNYSGFGSFGKKKTIGQKGKATGTLPSRKQKINAQKIQIQDVQQQQKADESTKFDPILETPRTISLLKIIIQRGGSPNEYDQKDQCLLIKSIIQNQTDIVKVLATASELDADSFYKKYKKSALHYVVNPLEYGSYENVEMFNALKEKFDISLKDEKGLTVADLAALQDSGKLKQAINKAGGKVNLKLALQRGGTSIITLANWPEEEIDFEEDSKTLLAHIKKSNNLSNEYIPVCDSRARGAGIGAQDGIEIVKDEEAGYYDLLMTKIDVRQGQYGQNVFYKMQLLHSKAREIYFVFTNWGRIGDYGQHQCTPFNKKEEAEKLFLKIFKEKAANDWKTRNETFEKKKGKYTLLKRVAHINYEPFIKNFDFEQIEKQKEVQKKTTQENAKIIEEITNQDQIRRTYRNYRVDKDMYSINKADLHEAAQILDEIKIMLDELDEHKKNLLSTDINVIFDLQEKIADKSTEYYMRIPNSNYTNQAIPPINSHHVDQYQKQIQSLLDIEVTSKIILGAHQKYEKQKIHPTDYCFNSLNIRMLPIENNHPEYKLIEKYVNNNNSIYAEKYIVNNIFAIERKGEAQRIAQHKNLSNRLLLWHGTSGYNLMSLFVHGLIPSYLGKGGLFGPGVYFSDSFEKAVGYSHNWMGNGQQNYKYLLLCEVALGEMKVLNDFEYVENLEAPYLSVKGQASKEPNPKNNVTLANGVVVPVGDYIPVEKGKCAHNEFIVKKESQIRIRYLVQIKA